MTAHRSALVARLIASARAATATSVSGRREAETSGRGIQSVALRDRHARYENVRGPERET